MLVTSVAVAGLLMAGTWLYGSILKGLAAEWASSPDSSYGLVLAAVAALVLFHRRRTIADAASSASPALPGGVLLLAGLLIYTLGIFGADIFLTRVSAVVVAAGIVLLFAGPRALRIALAPLTFLLLA